MTTLTAAWMIFVFVAVSELLCCSSLLTQHMRKSASIVLVLLSTTSHSAIIVSSPILVAVVVAMVGIYRLLNNIRLGYGRMNQSYLRKSCFKTSVVLLAVQLFGVISVYYLQNKTWNGYSMYALLFAATLLSIAGFVSVYTNSVKSRIKKPFDFLSSSDLPSLTIAIPARNETTSLADCLHAFTASHYEKLEIVVLDDCSQDKTSDIIRKFAHDGVRFVQGSEPGDTWLAKNAAYNKLANEANGEWILFCGVDVRVNADTLHRIISYAVANDLDMVSILPSRDPESGALSITQIIRYAWELALPRWLIGRPPVLSTMWLIRRQVLEDLGGLGAVRRKVVPESHFARELAKRARYAFLRANNTIAVTSNKDAIQQRQTALRVRYPQLHRRPELILVTSMVELLLMVAPLAGIAFGYIRSVPAFITLGLVCLVFEFVTMLIIVMSVTKNRVVTYLMQSVIALPLDLWLTHLSCYKYEFGIVEWKDRNVCLPVMHVVPRLPQID